MKTSPLAPALATLVACAAAPPPAPCPAAVVAPARVASSSAPTPAAEAVYRTVHLDTLAPDKVAQFVGARREWLGELARAHATDGRGVFLQVGDSHFYTLRSFAHLSELEPRRDAAEKSMATVPKEAGDRYDALCDSALVFPHSSEIWRFDGDMSYAPATGALTEWTADCGVFTSEDVRPDPASEERYEKATAEIDRALAQARFPLTRTVFHSAYGAGHTVTLLLARSKAELDAAPSVQAAVAQAVGPARAAELLAACEASVVRRESQPLTVRHDMTGPPPAS